MTAAPRFGLAFGSLVFLRAFLDGGSAGIAVTVIMFLFFAGVSGVAFLGASVVLGRRPLLTAAATALALLLLVTMPGLLSAPLTTLISARIGIRILVAWIYVCLLFAGLSRMVGMKSRALFLFALAASTLPAQLVEEFSVPRAGCCLQFSAQALADQLQDWNQLGRYHADNALLASQPVPAGRVIFLGDSITDAWKLAQSFPGKPYVNRGISGQTTSQMLVRLFPDVIQLKPAAMILLAGTNDIARNTGPVTQTMIANNVQAMTELAQSHGIKVILASVLPVSDYTARPQTARRPPADILKLNAWLKEYAAKSGAIYADYFSAFVDEKGWLRDGLAGDGLHPNAKGYELMAPIAEAAVRQALAR
ncbi:MAG TPA: SGNH/GDSL hydrolase family protein [Bryobacteraceae bacterium]|nr:SGNH/GDSL hydrolase family protein [Bryobacteraceae bacterium]